MKRFYKQVTTGEGHTVLLDGKPIKTPAQAALALPTAALAGAVADEWSAQVTDIKTEAMPLTRMANTAIDRTTILREHVTDELLGYGRNDLVAYRAVEPELLIARQRSAWDPLLAWLEEKHGARIETGHGINHIPQPDHALAALKRALEGLDTWQLTGLQTAVGITGSLALGLALASGRINATEAFRLSRIDEDFQAEKWGLDAEAEKRALALAHELEQAGKFIALAKA
jgi:chaperone required for assembly of F1-ATPase